MASRVVTIIAATATASVTPLPRVLHYYRYCYYNYNYNNNYYYYCYYYYDYDYDYYYYYYDYDYRCPRWYTYAKCCRNSYLLSMRSLPPSRESYASLAGTEMVSCRDLQGRKMADVLGGVEQAFISAW